MRIRQVTENEEYYCVLNILTVMVTAIKKWKNQLNLSGVSAR